MEIPGKYLLILGVMLVAGLLITGYMYAPNEVIQEKPINQEYIGTFSGQCNCILTDTINLSGGYNGGFYGRYFGKISYEGEEVYSNLTITNATLNGTVRGNYINSSFLGEINGRGRGYLNGTLLKKVQTGFAIPPLFWYYLGALIIFVVAYRLGIIDRLLGGRDEQSRGSFITEPDNEIYEKLKKHLHELTGEYPIAIRDVLHEPKKRTTEVIFYLVLENTQLVKLSYKGKDKFTLPVRIHEDDYAYDKREYDKRTILREQQLKLADEFEARERYRMEFEKRRPAPRTPPNEGDYQ